MSVATPGRASLSFTGGVYGQQSRTMNIIKKKKFAGSEFRCVSQLEERSPRYGYRYWFKSCQIMQTFLVV